VATSEVLAFQYAPLSAVDEIAEIAERETSAPFVIGLNHRTAPLGVRERLSVAEGKLEETARSLAELPAVDGACIISTCNRVEVIVSSSSDNVIDAVVDWLACHAGIAREALEPHLYIRRRAEAVSHLFRVASGLDSMIVGEPQIAGQVKKAFAAGALDSTLQRVFEQTMHVAKKVRSETGIGEHAVSIPYAAVELARKIFGELEGLRVLLLGAGEMGELTAEHLAAQHVRQIFVANKTYARAGELSERFGGTALQFASFEEQLAACDIVIVSTAAPHFVIEPAQVQRALEARSQRGVFLIDLSVPRNIDPAVASIDGAYLYDVDDLQHVADANMERRRCKAAHAEEIVAAEVKSYRRRAAIEDAVPTIVELQARLEDIRAGELEKCLRRLGPIRAEQREAIEQFSTRVVNKILHQPIVQLKEPTAEPRERESLCRTIRAIFGLG
jgi:glutamyl-tRNA reductase